MRKIITLIIHTLITPIFCIALLFSALFLFSGCIDEKLAIEDRLSCLNLTSKSFAFVPACDSIEECFSSVENSFNFLQENFSPRLNQKIFSYKNFIASSWLYYNNALKEISAINEICASEQNISEIPFHLNELSNHLTKAFNFANEANKLSFSILLLEKQVMLEEQIDLIKEEPLFNDFILIQNNLNEFSQTPQIAPNSDSYFSHYFSVLQKFNSLSEKFGFQAVITEEHSLLTLLDAFDEPILSMLQKSTNAFYIPFLSNIVSGMISYMSNSFALQNSVSVLETFPAFDFLQLYSELVGEQDSVFAHFVSVLENDSLHRKEIIEKNSATFSEISALIAGIQQEINFFSAKHYEEFDADFLNELYFLLEENKVTFSSDSFKISQVSEISSQAQKLLDELSVRFSALVNSSYIGDSSFGKKTSELKIIKNSLEELSSNLEFLQKNSLESIHALCKKQISLISETIPSNVSSAKAQNSVSKILFNIKQFNSSSGIDDSLWLCKSIVLEFNSLKKLLEDFTVYENDLNAQAKNCVDFLETVFSSKQLPQQFFSLKNQWIELLKQIDSFSDAELLASNCSLLQQQVEFALNETHNANALMEKFSSSNNSLSKLSAINSSFPEIVSEKELAPFKKSLEKINPFFSNSSIDWKNAFSNINTLEKDLSLQESALKQLLKDKIILFLQKTFKTELFSPENVPELNNDANFIVRISFHNPFQELNETLNFSIPFSFTAQITLLKKSSNISQAIFSDNKLLFDLNSLPSGETFVEFFSMQKIFAQETLQLISFSPEKAVFKKTLSFSNKFSLPKISISTMLDSFSCSFGKIFINSKQKQPSFTLSNNMLSFFDEEIFPNKNIEIYYELLNPVISSLSFKDSLQLDANAFLLKYAFALENKLPFELQKPAILLPLSLKKDSIISITSFDSFGNEFLIKITANKPLLEIPLLEKNATLSGELWVKVNSLSVFWQNSLNAAEKTIESLAKNSQFVKEEAEKLSENLSSLKGFPFSKENVESLQEIEKQAQQLAQEEKENASAVEQFISLKNDVKKNFESFSEATGFFKEFFPEKSLPLNEKLNTALQKFSEAENLFSKQQYKEALSLLSESFSLSSPFSSSSSTGFSELKKPLLEQVSENAERIEKEFTNLKKMKINSAQLFSQKEKLLSLEQEIKKAFSSNDFSLAKQHLKDFSEQVGAFDSVKNNAISERVSFVKNKLKNFLKLIEVPKEIALLEKELSSVSEDSLIKAKYILPIQKTELAKIKNNFLKVNNSSLKKTAEEILQKIDSNDSVNVMDSLQSFAGIEPEIDSFSENLQAQKQRALTAFNALKNDASLAVQKLSSQNFSEKLSPLLDKALNEFEQENFLKTIAVTGLLSAAEIDSASKPQDFLPFSIIPIIIALLFFIVLKKRKNKKREESLKIVPNNSLLYS